MFCRLTRGYITLSGKSTASYGDPVELSQRVRRIKPSPTLAITARAAQLRAAGKDIIGFGAGEPDFDTPEHVKQAAIEAIRAGFTKYTAVAGTPQLRQAVADKFKRDNGLDYRPDQTLVSVGGKQSFYNLAQALLSPGDEVIIPAPYWVSYPDMVLLADGVPVIVEGGIDQGFKITPQQLAALLFDSLHEKLLHIRTWWWRVTIFTNTSDSMTNRSATSSWRAPSSTSRPSS